MLSPGRWHEQVPRDLLGNLHFRQKLLSISKRGTKEQKALLEACKQDFLFFVNAFVWQFNPNAIGGGSLEVGPFITWEFQQSASLEILDSIHRRKDVVIEKSREMGASWLCLLVMLWIYLFHPWKKFLCISRSEDAVDRPGDPDCLFWKLDFVIRHLPGWMTLGRVKRRKLGFTNPLLNSSITGQASTGKAGVGGRATAMFIDEFSQIDEDQEVLHRTSDTTGCRIFNGTHRGQGTAFFELTQRVDWRKLVMHWTQHPDKRRGLYRYDEASNQVDVLDKQYAYPEDFQFVHSAAPAGGPFPGLRSPWYDEQCVRKPSSRAVAMDLDVDPGGSVAQVFNALTIRSLISAYCKSPVWEGDINYDPDSGKPLALVEVPGGPLKLWIKPKPDGGIPEGRYGAGNDLSTGLGATNSCLSIMSANLGEKVAEYATPNIPPERFALVATAICWLFKTEDGDPALLSWEHKGPGFAFAERVIQTNYPRIYYSEAHLGLSGGKTGTTVPGWNPTNENKRSLIENYNAALSSRWCVNFSEVALRECLGYRYNACGDVEHPSDVRHEDPTGARVNHGDRVIADGLAWKMCQKLGIVQRSSKVPDKVPVGSLAWRRELAEVEQDADRPYFLSP